MPRQLETCTDAALASLIIDAQKWHETGVLPDGILHIEADKMREAYPSLDVAYSRTICREEAFREAAIRWMETQGFKI